MIDKKLIEDFSRLSRGDNEELRAELIEEKLIEDFSKLSGGENEEFRDDVIDILIEKNADMSQQERNVMLHFVKGHHGENVVSTVLDIINRTDPNATNQLSDKFLKFGMKIEEVL